MDEYKDNTIAHAHLRQLILEQIESQEKNHKLFKKIQYGLGILQISLLISIVIGIVLIVFMIREPGSKASVANKKINELNSRISIQRIAIEMDKEKIQKDSVHLENIRSEIKNIIKTQDSLKKLKY